MNNDQQKISVFGGSGFIGGRFCEMYPDNVVKVAREDRHSPTNNLLYFISTVDNYNVYNNLHVDIDTNLTVLMDVLDNLKKDNKVKPVINFVSSWFVYGQNYEIPFREDFSHCNPTGFYSITKCCAEQLLVCWCNTFGYEYRILRLANVLGEGDRKISKKKNALQFLIREIVNNRDVELYYGGEVLRDYIYVDDVCDALKLCVEKSPTNQIYNVGGGSPLRFLDIINRAIAEAKSTSKIIHIQPTTFHNTVQVRHSYLDTAKLRNLGFAQKFNADIIVKRLVEHYQKNGN